MPTEIQTADYLAQRLGAPVIVRSLKQTFPGLSNETWIVQAEVNGTPQGLVLRIEPPEGSGGPNSMRFEYDVYRTLFATEIPVAEALWYDDGLDFAEGRPHMIRRLVDGSTTVDGLHDSGDDAAARRKRIAFECVEMLARIHTLDWRAHGFDQLIPAPASPAECWRHEFGIWQQHWWTHGPYPSPLIEEALCWLEELIPSDSPTVSLVKGNNGIGEEIWKDDRIVAMSDWELTSLGDGLADLFWSQGTLGLADFGEILSHYEARTGHAVSPERLAFTGVFSALKQFICGCAFWYSHFHHRRSQRAQLFSARACFMLEFEHRLGQCIGKPLDEAFAIANKSNKALYTELGRRRS